ELAGRELDEAERREALGLEPLATAVDRQRERLLRSRARRVAASAGGVEARGDREPVAADAFLARPLAEQRRLPTPALREVPAAGVELEHRESTQRPRDLRLVALVGRDAKLALEQLAGPVELVGVEREDGEQPVGELQSDVSVERTEQVALGAGRVLELARAREQLPADAATAVKVGLGDGEDRVGGQPGPGGVPLRQLDRRRRVRDLPSDVLVAEPGGHGVDLGEQLGRAGRVLESQLAELDRLLRPFPFETEREDHPRL